MKKRLVKLRIQFVNSNGSICYKGETISLPTPDAQRLVLNNWAVYADDGPAATGPVGAVAGAVAGRVTKPVQIVLTKRTGLERLAYLRGRIKAYGVKVAGRSGDAMQAQLNQLIVERGVIE